MRDQTNKVVVHTIQPQRLQFCKVANINLPVNVTLGFAEGDWCLKEVYCISPDQKKTILYSYAAPCGNTTRAVGFKSGSTTNTIFGPAAQGGLNAMYRT